MKRSIPLAALALAAPLFGGARGCIPDDPPPPDECICPAIYAPVCGVDGNTYSSACAIECADVEIAHDGECGGGACSADQDCAVGSICQGDPTCLDAPCMADDPYCSRYCPGTCEACVCPEVWAPVCGEDGNTYGNACEARCGHVAITHDGECGGPVECRSDDECAPEQTCQLECWAYDAGGGDGGTPRDPGAGWAGCAPPPECRGTCVDRVVCEPVLCDLYCEFGNAVDERGCEICACNPPPPVERYCFADDECDALSGEICDTTECRSPCEGGYDGDEACPPVCYGVCRRPLPEPEPVPASR